MKYRSKLLKELRFTNFIFLSFAGLINSIGVTIFLVPLGLLDGGLSGTAFLLDFLTPSYLSLSFFLLILNFPFFILGYKKLGGTFVVYSLFAIFAYSLFSFLIQHILPISFENGSPIVSEDILLAALFGGLFSGIGSGLVIRFGGALDGVEVLAVLFAKKIGLTVGTFVMSYNVLLYTIAALIFKSWTIPLYSVIAYFVGIKTVDFIVEGLDKSKAAFIITSKDREMMAILSKKLGRGLTAFDARSYYSDTDKKIIYCVINRFEIPNLKKYIKEVDPDSFVTINEVSDVIGTKPKLTLKFKGEKHMEKNYEKLANGVEIPRIGFGTWQIENGDEAYQAVSEALKAGYRHIDSAIGYGNEESVGRAIRESDINRREVFVTTKIPAEVKTYEEAKNCIEQSLKKLQTNYIDLFLIHAPRPWAEMQGGAITNRYFDENLAVWRALEEAYSAGKIHAIGVSNFDVEDMKNIVDNCKILPMVNQILFYVGFDQRDVSSVFDYCLKHGIVIEAYSPLATGKVLNDRVLLEIAEHYHKTPAQVCIKYCIQKGAIPLPKSTHVLRIKENLDIDFEITDEDMERLDLIKA